MIPRGVAVAILDTMYIKNFPPTPDCASCFSLRFLWVPSFSDGSLWLPHLIQFFTSLAFPVITRWSMNRRPDSVFHLYDILTVLYMYNSTSRIPHSARKTRPDHTSEIKRLILSTSSITENCTIIGLHSVRRNERGAVWHAE